MNTKIKEIYIEELEKDITEKINELGYNVTTCNVYATLSSKNEESYIEQIELNVEKGEEKQENQDEEETFENKLVSEIQKIKPVNTTITKNNQNNNQDENQKSINMSDIQKIKKFLIEEYGVDEKCLKIN